MLLEEAQAAKFRSEGLQPVFLGSSKLKKKNPNKLLGREGAQMSRVGTGEQL